MPFNYENWVVQTTDCLWLSLPKFMRLWGIIPNKQSVDIRDMHVHYCALHVLVAKKMIKCNLIKIIISTLLTSVSLSFVPYLMVTCIHP